MTTTDSPYDRDFLMDLWHRQNGRCAFSGLPLRHSVGLPYSATLWFDPCKKEHTRENTRLVCRFIYLAGHDLSASEITGFLDEYYEHRKAQDAARDYVMQSTPGYAYLGGLHPTAEHNEMLRKAIEEEKDRES